MNRRQVLAGLAAVAGHALFPEVLGAFARASAAMDAAPEAWPRVAVSEAQGRVLAEAVETILPETATPGARAARVHVFVDLVLAHCATPDARTQVLAGLDALGPGFLAASTSDRQQALGALPKETLALLKELTVLGYFTSEIGATQALAYDKVPGVYRGCLDLQPGQKGWATR
jgi:glucoside 3-dehydrogenase (cytochrome c) hitch-hiker subunit